MEVWEDCSIPPGPEEQLEKAIRSANADRIAMAPWRCPYCEYASAWDKAKLRTHCRRIHVGPKPIKCRICEGNFNTQTQLTRHMKISHPTENPYHCQKCKKDLGNVCEMYRHKKIHANVKPQNVQNDAPDCPTFKSGTSINSAALPTNDFQPLASQSQMEHKSPVIVIQPLTLREILQHVNEGRSPSTSWQCPYCDKSTTKHHLYIHCEILHLGKKLFKCTICMTEFKTSKHLSVHTLFAHPNFCHFCQQTFDSSAVLAKHLKLCRLKQKDKNRFQCEYCQKYLSKKESLEGHIRSHLKEKPLKCRFCNKKFTYRSNLKEHEKHHLGIRPLSPFQCTECDQSYQLRYNLTIHQRNRHGAEKPFKCRDCEKVFATTSLRTQHEKTHTGIKPFKCGICGVAFLVKPNLMRHVSAVHEKIKPYKCKFCDREFAEDGTCKRHELIHAGSRPHSCGYCERAFRTSNELKQHVRHHLEQNPYKCSYCEKSFTSSNGVHRHMRRLHLKELNLNCRVCGKAFYAMHGLNEHLRIHTGEKPYQCPKCPKSFAKGCALTTHLKTKFHNTDLVDPDNIRHSE